MGYDFEEENVKSGAGRSRHRDRAARKDAGTGQRRPDPVNEQKKEQAVGPQQGRISDRREKKTAAGISGMPPKKKPSKTRRRIIAMIIAECFALLFIFGYGFVARRWNMIQRMEDWVPEEVENPNFSVDLPQYQKQKGHWGIYIFGVDSRGSNVGKGTNADVNIICDINHDTGEIRLVSVFRDSYLNVNDNGSYNKINQAYFTGGPSNAAKMLNKNLDLNISDFVTFNWKAVADGINILGGVDMEISKAEFYYINSFITETVEATGVYSTHLKHAGMNHLDGVQAVAYGRLRLMDTDFARTERQRKVIQAAFEKAKKADFATLNQLTLTLFPQVATSVDMQDIISLLGDVGKYYIGETGGFPFARGDANMGKKGACVIPQTLESNVKELHQFLYGEENYIPSNTVKTISAKISGDTGMYNQGVSVGHVSTDGGAIPNPTKAAKPTEAKENETDEEDQADSSSGESQSDDEEDSKKETTSSEEDGSGNGEDSSKPSQVETRPSSTEGERPGGTRPGTTSPGDRDDNRPVTEPTAASDPSGGNSHSGQRPGGSAETPSASAGNGDPGSTGGNTTLNPGSTGGPGSNGTSGPTDSGSQGTENTPGSGTSGSQGSQGSIQVPRPGASGSQGSDSAGNGAGNNSPGGNSSGSGSPGGNSAGISSPGGSSPGGNPQTPDSSSSGITNIPSGPGITG